MSGDERQPIVGPSAPCLSLALALIAGIWLGERQPISLSLIVFCAPLVPLVFIYYRYRKMGWLIALCVVAAVGALLIHARLNTSVPAHHIAWFSDGERVVLTGIVDEPPVRRQEDSVIIIRSESVGEGSHAVAVTGRVRITVKDPAVSWRYGDRLRLKVKLNHPRNFGNPGAFDYVGYLNRKGIRVAGYLRNVDGVHVVAANRANPVFGWFDRRRLELEKFLDAHTEPPGRGLLKALLIGERAEVTGEMRDAFVSAGAVHVMAISGLHLGIIVTLVFFAAQWALRRSESILLRWNVKKVAALVTMVPLMGYIMITGCPISTIRAGIMAGVFLVAVLIDRQRNTLNSLALAALLVLTVSPISLWDASFQLSFVSVFGIVVLTPPLYRWCIRSDPLDDLAPSRWRKVFRGVLLSLIASFAALVVTSPVVAFHFHRVSTMTLVSNAVIVPMVGFVILPMGLLAILLLPLSSMLAGLLAKGAAHACDVGITVMEWIAAIPFSSGYVPGPTPWEIVLFGSLIGTLLWRTEPVLKRIVLGLVIILLLADLGYWGLRDLFQRELRVTFLDVGEGDCALVEFPGGGTMLVDGGGLFGDFDVGERVVAPFLWNQRILSVDYLVLSHPQPDHYKGFGFIAAHFGVKEFWHNGVAGAGESYRMLDLALQSRRIPRVRISDGYSRMLGGSRVDVYHPAEASSPRAPNSSSAVNNQSVVMKISFGAHSVLFAGDIEGEAEGRLLRDGKDVHATVIKVPHHGSQSSNTYYFVKEVSPRLAVISAGFRNPFTLPHQRVVQRYEAMGCRVVRTDLDGAVSVQTDGRDFTVRTYREVRQ